MGTAHRDGVPSYVSPITAWEVGMLSSRGRLQLLIRPERWFANLFEAPGVRLADMFVRYLDSIILSAGKTLRKTRSTVSSPRPRASSAPH